MDCDSALNFILDLTEDDPQRLKEIPSDSLEEIRQQYESFLTELEALAVEAIATNDWNDFYRHLIEFQTEHDLHGVTGIAICEEEGEVSADSMDSSSADSPQTT